MYILQRGGAAAAAAAKPRTGLQRRRLAVTVKATGQPARTRTRATVFGGGLGRYEGGPTAGLAAAA